MIHSFTCSNFYSFGDSATINFVVDKNAPNNSGYFVTSAGTRLSKVETVIGSNASGKTNVLKALPFLKWLIVDSFKEQPGEHLPVQPFAFCKKNKEASDLSVTFEIEGKIYTYAFSVSSSRIEEEILKVTSFVKEKKATKKLFSRTWNKATKSYEFDPGRFQLPKEFKNLLRDNASVIGTAARLNHSESKTIAKYWQNLETNVVEAGWVGDRLMPNATQQLLEAFAFFGDNNPLKKEAEKLLARFDLGLDSFQIKKEKTENGMNLQVRAIHTIDGDTYPMHLNYESSGTKQLFVLLKSILLALAHGTVAVIDEFDVNLHPEMLLALVDLFVQEDTNPKNAQLLFSSHSHLVLSRLDKYQIILVEKNEKSMSEAWRLDYVSGVRPDDNYFAKYLAGAYGAVPNIK